MSFLDWFTPPHFEQEAQKRDARNLYSILISIFGFEVIFCFLIPIIYPENPAKAFSFTGVVIIYTLLCYILLHQRKLWLASFLFCIFLGITSLGTSVVSNSLDSLTIQIFPIVILISGLLLGARYSFSFAIFGMASVLLLYIGESTGVLSNSQTTVPTPLKVIIPSFVFLISALLINIITRLINNAIQHTRENETKLQSAIKELNLIQSSLEQQINQRTAQLKATVEISQTMNYILDPDQLGKLVIQKLITLYDYDFAAIFLIENTGKWALLRYSNQTISHDSQAETLQLEVTKNSSIANAIRTRKTQITNFPADISQIITPYISPEIRTEIALPLHSRGKALGAISLQSSRTLSFSSEEMALLESIASQIAATFENARLFNETQQQLDEINRLNQMYLQTTWRAMLAQKFPAYQFSQGNLSETDRPNEIALEIAHQAHKVTIKNQSGESILVAPILFQNEVLGAIELTLQDRKWTHDEVVIVEAVLSQTARSLENTRLILETRNRAEQEKTISEISSRFRETLDLETILQTSVQEMQKGLKLSEVEIRLLPSTEQDDFALAITETGE